VGSAGAVSCGRKDIPVRVDKNLELISLHFPTMIYIYLIILTSGYILLKFPNRMPISKKVLVLLNENNSSTESKITNLESWDKTNYSLIKG
jgi:hypothetical protein